MHFIDWKSVAHNGAIQRKQFLKRGNCAQKEKIYPNGNVKPVISSSSNSVTPHMSSDSPCFLSSEQDDSDRSLPGIIHDALTKSANDHARRSCSFQSLFCLDRPFGFSVHRDTHFCPSRLSRFSTCRVYIFIFIPNFCPNLSFCFLVRRDAHFLPGLFYSFCPAGQFMRSIFWLHLSWQGKENLHHPLL